MAVSGIVGGKALKGPADRMLASLGFERAPSGWPGIAGARRFVLDDVDRELEPSVGALGLRTLVTDTIMADHAGRERLARTVLEFATS